MTMEIMKALSDSELGQVIAWAQEEQKPWAERRKQETIAKIKEIAGAARHLRIHSQEAGRAAEGILGKGRQNNGSNQRILGVT